MYVATLVILKKTFTCNWYLFATGVIEMSSGSRRIKCQICGQVQY